MERGEEKRGGLGFESEGVFIFFSFVFNFLISFTMGHEARIAAPRRVFDEGKNDTIILITKVKHS